MTPPTGPRPTSPIPLEELDASVGDVRDVLSLPPDCYTSDAFFEFEKATIWSHEWFCVGRAEQVPEPGDYRTITVVNEPLIMVRRRDGEIAVLTAVCQHRGMKVVDDHGNCGRYLRCPYHWWTYELDGRLVATPKMTETKGFDRADHGLPSLAVEIWNGFVFANFDHGAEPLAPRLSGLDDHLRNYHLGDLVTSEVQLFPREPFNWKLMMENGVEPYHATYLHSGMFEPPPTRHYTNLGFDDDQGYIVSVVHHGLRDMALNPTYQPLFPVIETLTDEERARFAFGTVPPNLMLGWQSDMVFWFLLLPNEAATVDMQWGLCMPASTHGLINYGQLLTLARQGIEDYNAEDLPVAEAMHEGMASRFAPRGRYSVEEEVLAHLNRWLITRYNEYAGRELPLPHRSS
jgi:phenylpropionate dioxygenase-like ring-hydroxylating dioxygenase large terminal subunit